MRSKKSLRRAGQRGFTLIELFIVVGIVAILAAIASPYFGDMVGRYRLNSAARATASYLSSARMLAVTRGTRVQVVFTEIDSNAADEIQRGVFRVEEWDRQKGGWKLVNDPAASPREAKGNWAVNDCIDPLGGVLNEYCVDFKDGPSGSTYRSRFPSVSIAKVDNINLFEGAFPRIVFTPDGLVENELADFAQGNDRQNIRLVLSSTRRTGNIEFRIISVSRSGTVKVEPYLGPTVPAT